MFKRLLDWFSAPETQESPSNETERAIAALMIEVALADDSIEKQEREKLPELLRQHTGLTTQECLSLIEIAEEEVDNSVSLYEFTQHLDKQLSIESKCALVTRLWLISLADNEIDRYEEHTIRKISDLLHLRHSEFMQCKHEALNTHG
jgi:uncharacterized tellurite resistance protein B-like protein